MRLKTISQLKDAQRKGQAVMVFARYEDKKLLQFESTGYIVSVDYTTISILNDGAGVFNFILDNVEIRTPLIRKQNMYRARRR